MAIRQPRVTIQVDTKKTENMIDNFTIAFRRNIKMGAKRIAGIYALAYLHHIRKVGIQKWTGHAEKMLADQITNPPKLGAAERVGAGFGVRVPGYLIALDRFDKQPHIVALKPGRSITRWYKRKVGEPLKGVRKGRRIQYQTIRIKRKPWIDDANMEARQYIVGIIDNVKNRIKSEVS